MADTHPENPGAGSGAPFDLSQFYQIFFDEAAENLDQMEHMLLHVDLSNANDEQLNAIFRCAHSIKGGAATFGFTDIAELTHQMESLLDRVRRRELLLSPELVDVLLDSSDLSRELLTRHQEGETTEPPSTVALVGRISDLMSGGQRAAAAAANAGIGAGVGTDAASASPQAEKSSDDESRPLRKLILRIGPMTTAEAADEVVDLLCNMPHMEQLDELPVLQANVRALVLETAFTDDEMRDLLAFHVASDQLSIESDDVPGSSDLGSPSSFGLLTDEGDDFFGLFSGAPGLPSDMVAAQEAAVAGALQAKAAVSPAAGFEHRGSSAAHIEAATIRVAVHKVDQLINLVGELVITQAMLAQNSRDLDPRVHQQLLAGLADLDRNTRELQESVMSIRMIPMSVVFNRFPRMLRDLALKCGKNVELVTQGEATELDKSLVEKSLTRSRTSCATAALTASKRRMSASPRASPSMARSRCPHRTRAARS